jgi:HAD superfamily hydrolase (TIGR01509 family)
MTTKTPTIAFIGLPNSGKSTLINRICGRTTAIVANEAHTTRDVNSGYDFWEGYYMKFVDTGGLVPDPADKIQSLVQVKSWEAIATSDILVLLIDRKQDIETIPQSTVQRIWKTGKPLIVAINKVDDPNTSKEDWEYAFLGGQDFVNLSSMNGFGINDLLDKIVALLEKEGFEKNEAPVETLEEVKQEKKGRKNKLVSIKGDGSIVIYRDTGDGLFQSTVTEDVRVNKIEWIAFDFDNTLNSVKNLLKEFFVAFNVGYTKEAKDKLARLLEKAVKKDNKKTKTIIKKFFKDQDGEIDEFDTKFEEIINQSVEIHPSTIEVFKQLKEGGYKIAVASNSTIYERSQAILKSKYAKYFEAYVDPYDSKVSKPDILYFENLHERMGNVELKHVVFFDDKSENVLGARVAGMWGVEVTSTEMNFIEEIERIELGFADRIPKTAKILLLGRPNVGKSSLFNALFGEDKQIVTEIAGTTLSVNEEKVYVPEIRKDVLLLDTVGIRKPGKRTFGAESFATFRTIEAAHEADVILLVMDGSTALTQQDLIVAGVAKGTKAGIVVVANKEDIVSPEQRERFIKDFNFKLNFLKVDQFVWVSATDIAAGKAEESKQQIWDAVENSIVERKRVISREEIRKLFNYLMKKRPPKKLHNKKKAIIYDLLFTKVNPPTFELLVKDKTTIHWSYLRFLENTLRRQFHLTSGSIKVKMFEIAKKNVL